ncbi:unnamed protein product [Moneuplotes crassus]|uniref:Uncharacterized protein n=2 Tax=Euplotes crassus TaxID=5936 RepID=A0AAD1Y5G3_EUPCR|nr:unnamed protein product [Moneuplotes crassus]
MAYSNSNRFRPIDKFTNYFWNDEKTSTDDLINDPERFLLTQDGVFDAEGGYTGAFIHFSVLAGGIAALFAFRPTLATYFMKGSLRFNEWALIGGTGILSYQLGYWTGVSTFGDAHRLENHYAAYTLVKSQNRYEGRTNLLKKPSF